MGNGEDKYNAMIIVAMLIVGMVLIFLAYLIFFFDPETALQNSH